MFGGKKLKDLTEEDIRKYAASLVAMHGGQEEAATDGEIRLAANDTGNRNGYVESGMEDESSAHRKRLAQVIASNAAGDPDRIDEGDPEALQQRQGDEAVEATLEAEAAEAAEAPALSPEEQTRLMVLSELERCQMPAVKKEGGGVQKTIEHYTFADSLESATIIIEADKDLYGGAAQHVKEEHVEVLSKDNELVVILHELPTAATAATRADWTLRLAPLCHSVESDRTSWKLRRGKISVKLTKRKPQEWKRAVKV